MLSKVKLAHSFKPHQIRYVESHMLPHPPSPRWKSHTLPNTKNLIFQLGLLWVFELVLDRTSVSPGAWSARFIWEKSKYQSCQCQKCSITVTQSQFSKTCTCHISQNSTTKYFIVYILFVFQAWLLCCRWPSSWAWWFINFLYRRIQGGDLCHYKTVSNLKPPVSVLTGANDKVFVFTQKGRKKLTEPVLILHIFIW